MGGGGDDVITGYRYFAGIHLIFCHKVDRLLKILVGEKEAWPEPAASTTFTADPGTFTDFMQYVAYTLSETPGEPPLPVTESKTIGIYAPSLFGGDSKEGGIKGRVDVCFGGPTEPRNAYLSGILGNLIPAFRGLFGLVGNKLMLSANNPYIKSWAVLIERTATGWREDLAKILASDGYYDMNPIHIIRECLTDTTWGGLGYPTSDIDDASFQTAATLLYAENFGLSVLWSKNNSIHDFIALILDHIDGKLFFSHTEGLLKIKLVRKDYDSGAISSFDESNIVELVEFLSPTVTESTNNVIIEYLDRTNTKQSITAHDLAGLMRCGGQLNTTTLTFDAVADVLVANKIAERELKQLSMPISSVTMVVNRSNSDIEPGDVFNFSWESLGIDSIVMRVSSIEFNAQDDSKIRVVGVRDVYTSPTGAFLSNPVSLWSNPSVEPANATRIVVEEATWWQAVREIFTTVSEEDLAAYPDTTTVVVCFCGKSTIGDINYEMWDRNTGASAYAYRDRDSFPFNATLEDAIEPEVESVITILESSVDTDIVKVGTYAKIGDELVSIVSINLSTMEITVTRGVLDTIPISHSSGTYIWFHANRYGDGKLIRSVTESVDVKILPTTGVGTLPITSATENTIVCAGRMMLPYPPGNVKINGTAWNPSIGLTDALALTWSHRDRLLQTASFVRQDATDIGPEDGVTYTLRIYGETDTLIRTVSSIATTSYTYLTATEISDSGLGRLNTSLRFELESVRGSLVSYRKWNLTVTRS